MCGIAGLYIKDPNAVKSQRGLENMVDMLLLGIENRGKHASGFVAMDTDGRVVFDKADEPASKFIQGRQDLPANTKIVLVHTRFMTKGSEKVAANNHPVIYNTCFTTHNGSINNDDALFEAHKLERRAEVDTEIISALIDKGDWDMEKIKDYLADMDGPAAIASLDTRHPGELILAKTTGSPLEYIDQEKFLMWASTVDCMRNAWGAILGTPPRAGKFRSMSTRTMHVVTDEGVRKVDIPFVPTKTGVKPSASVGSQSSKKHGQDGSTAGTEKQNRVEGVAQIVARGRAARHGKAESSTEQQEGVACGVTNRAASSGNQTLEEAFLDGAWKVGNVEIRDTVYAQRKNGVSVVRVYADLHKFPFNVQIGPWPSCGCCYEKIHVDDIQVCSRGHWCKDCYETWMELVRALPDNSEGEIVETDLTDADFHEINKVFTSQERLNLDIWSSDEDFYHSETIKILAGFVHMDEEALDWLLFRIKPEQVEAIGNPEVVEWIKDVQDKYDQIYADQWDQYGDENMDGGVKALKRKKALPAGSVTWIEKQRRDREAANTPAPPTPGLPGTSHGTHPLASQWADGRPRVIVPRLMGEAKKANGHNCAFCRRKHKLKIIRAETTEVVQYCTRHFKECQVRGCKKDANHTRHDGIRVCHEHARSTPKVYADAMLRKEGYVVGSQT